MVADAEQPAPAEQPSEPTEFNAAAAIQALLDRAPEPQEPEDDEDDVKPIPAAPETPAEPKEPAEPSAEVEGAVIEAKTDKAEPEKPAAERKAETPAPEAAKADSAPNPQDQLLTQLNSLIPQLQASIAGKFADIKTQEDLLKVGREDPARYNEFVIHQAQLQHAQSEQQRLATDAYGRWYQGEAEKLAKALPDYADPAKGQTIRSEIREFALKQGYDEQRLQRASAADVVMLHKAMQFDKLQAADKAKPAEVAAAQAKAKEKAAQAPKVQRPGVPEGDGKENRVRERTQQFQRSGHLDDLTALLIDSGIA